MILNCGQIHNYELFAENNCRHDVAMDCHWNILAKYRGIDLFCILYANQQSREQNEHKKINKQGFINMRMT